MKVGGGVRKRGWAGYIHFISLSLRAKDGDAEEESSRGAFLL